MSTRDRLVREARERDPDWVRCDECLGAGRLTERRWYPGGCSETTNDCDHCGGAGGWYGDDNQPDEAQEWHDFNPDC